MSIHSHSVTEVSDKFPSLCIRNRTSLKIRNEKLLRDTDLLLVYSSLECFNLHVYVQINVTLKLGTESFLTFLSSFFPLFLSKELQARPVRARSRVCDGSVLAHLLHLS